MGLLDLPYEIVDEIISLTLPYGIESFALCCTAVHMRAASQIQQHNTLKQQWKYKSHTSTCHGDTLRMLFEIFREPLAAQYIESLNMLDRRQITAGDLDDFRADRGAMERVKNMVMGSEYLDNAGVDADDWWERMKKEDETGGGNALYTTVLLLSQLSNLKTLQLPHGWQEFRQAESTEEDDNPLVSVLDAIVECSNSGSGREKALGKLETILPFVPKGYEELAGLQHVQWFVRLKSARRLYLVSCLAVEDQYTGIPFQWRFTRFTSPLRRVELAYCCMDAEGISVLLSHTPFLKAFKYSHQTQRHGCQHDWNPGAFNEAIARHCGQTITRLAITLDELHGDICNGVSSFHSFPNLETLEVDIRIFNGPPVESGQVRGACRKVPEGEKPWTEEDIPCLGSMLPASILEVQLNTDFQQADKVTLSLILKNAREERQTRLKRLDTFTVRQYNGDSARALVEEAGVTLYVFNQKGARPRSRSMMPVWKQEFEERTGGLGLA